jgi:prolyl-tRNA synthetase
MKKIIENAQKNPVQKTLINKNQNLKIQKNEKSKTLEKDLPVQNWKECKTWTFLP